MSSDWIKMRTDLYRDPKVSLIADYLMCLDSDLARHVNQNRQSDMCVTRNVMRNVTVGSLVSVWGVLRHRGKRIDDDLLIKNCTLYVIDDLADIPGFGDAMASVGWAVKSKEGIVFPNFFSEFNTDPSEDIKAKNAERQRRYREKNRNVTRNVTVTSQSNAREEKRRDKEKVQKESSRFTPPTIEEVRTYCQERGNSVDPVRFISHYESAGWMRGKTKIKDWKACVRTWERSDQPNQQIEERWQ